MYLLLSNQFNYHQNKFYLLLSIKLHIMSKYKALQVSLEQNTDIGYVPINIQSSYEFFIDNKNDIPVSYRWKHTVFQVEPSSGVLLPKTHNKFRITFITQQAVVVIGTIVLEAEKEEPRVFKMSVIGKYSNLGCSNQPIEFGATTVGKIASKKVIIKNSSVVPSSFKVKNQTTSNFKDNPFTVTPSHGQIPPKSSYELDIKYSPTISDMVYNGRFTVQSESGNNLSLACHAKSVSFDVSLSPKSINFGQVKLQSTTNRAITLQNNSDADTDYQFFCETGNVFSIGEFKGTIPANSFKKVIVQFDPKNTICYYERIYCIVRNHKLLYVDMMGTCYDLLIKPLPIVQIHVDLFRRRVIEGRLSEIDFKYLESNLQIKINKKLQLLRDQKSLMSLEQFDLPEINFQETETALHKQLFLEGTQNQLLTLSTDFIDFGHCDTMTISSQQEMLITNNLPCKMTIYWINQKRENFNGSYMTAFQIYPESATIKPGASTKFSISFRPLKSQFFFFQQFQFFALKEGGKMSKKTLEQYQKKQLKTLKPQVTLLRTLKVTQTIQSKVTAQLETAQVMPPLHGIVRCVGNSFGIPSSAYIPIMKLYPSKNIVFAPSKIGESKYQTVELINDSDTPTYFRVSPDANKIFRVFPKAGLIEGRSFQILTLEFTPKANKSYNSTIPIHLNGSNGNPLLISLIGECPQPKIKIPHNKLFFSKCFLGVCSKQTFTVENVSRLPVNFRAEIPEKYEDEVFFSVNEKKLQSNQSLNIELCFIPQFKKQYKIRIPIKIIEDERSQVTGYYKPGSGIQDSSLIGLPKQQDYFIEVFGEGGDGSLVLEKQDVDFGVVKVLQQKKIQVKLSNLSDCTFYVEYSLKSNTKDATSHDIQSSFTLDSAEGTLVAKGQILIGITFSPIDVKDFDVSLIVSARQKYPKALKLPSKNINVAKCVLSIKAQGSYPLLQAVDIRNDALSVTALWQNFELSSFNHSMSTNLTPYQKKYLNIETLPFAESQALKQKLTSFVWNFGFISSKNISKPRKVLLTVKNFGGIDLDYNFKFPFDNAVKKEIWADPGQPTKEQAYQKAIISKNIFQVKPKFGKLKPGQSKDIQLIYTPASITKNKNANQEHSLSTVLEIKNGKAMVINFKGTTLGPQEGLLVVKKKAYTFPPTPIGMMTPLKFPIELQNVGSAKVSYNADIQYQTGEYEEVFSIINPSGALANLEKNFMYCTFKPLECKQYKFKIILNVESSDKILTQVLQIQMRGRGYDKVLEIPKIIKHSKQIPSQRALVSDLGSKVFFSIQEIDFSAIKPFEIAYKMVIIYNLSTTHSLTFDFPQQNISENKNSFTCGDKFAIQPNNGEILPNEFVQLKITLTADEAPSCYEGEIECHVTWNNKDAQNANVNANTMQKEVLFLRIKKQSEMSLINKNAKPTFSNKFTIFDNIFSNIIQSSLMDVDLINSFNQVQQLPPGIIDYISEDSAVNIEMISPHIDKLQPPKNQVDHSIYKTMFVNQEFLSTAEIILQNTFFNIIQQTTHGENDLLRVTKKFITSKNINDASRLEEEN